MLTTVAVAALSAAGFLGASMLALARHRVDARARSLSVAVAAGVLLATSFVDLYPEALELAGDDASWGFAAGFALLVAVEMLTRGHTHHTPQETIHRHALAPFVAGLAIHNIADGFSLGVAADLSVETAAGVGTGILVHQLPVGLSLAAVLIAAGADRSQTLRVAGSLALAIPLTAGIAAAIPTPAPDVLGFLVGLAGGVLAYMGASHLLPEAQSERAGALPAITFVITLAATTLLLLAL